MSSIIKAAKSKDFKEYASAEFVEGRTILDITYIAGSYGMGGYGFLGFQLAANEIRAGEWLVCTLFSADNWFTVNGHWLSCHPDQHEEQKPLRGQTWKMMPEGYYAPTGETWDDFKPLILNQKLIRFECERKWCRLIIGVTLVEIQDDSSVRPIHFGSKEPRELDSKDDLRRAWILAKEPRLFI